MAVRALDRPVLVGNAAIVAGRPHAIVGAQLLVSQRQIVPHVALEIAEGGRQSYCRIARTAAMMAGRYAHAKQFKRHQRQLRLLRSRLGRIIRDIRHEIEDANELMRRSVTSTPGLIPQLLTGFPKVD